MSDTQKQPAEPVDDPVTVPRGLLGAACAAIERKRDAPKTLAELRRYTVGDLSASPPPAQPTQAEPACGCRIGECESKPPPLVCRMTEEIKRGES